MSDEPTAAPRAPRALVVDDDPVTRLLVQRALQEMGLGEVLLAADGLAAQDVLREHGAGQAAAARGVDIVVTDVLMPGMDGLDLLRWGREHCPGTVWVLLSGVDTFDAAVEAVRLGAFDFLSKPPNLAELEVVVRNALERQRLARERERLIGELDAANAALRAQVIELEEKSELLRRDLERAEVIQRTLLPTTPPATGRYCVRAAYRPGRYVGGDLYDVLRVGERHLALYVADATGHGVTAAMLSVLFKQRLVVSDAATGTPLAPRVVLRAANDAIGTAVRTPGLFLTAAYCLLDTTTGAATFASAGHPPVLHVRADGTTTRLQRTGPALGLTAGATYGETRFQLAPDDRLLLYTDGLLRAGGAAETDRLCGLLAGRAPDAGALLDALVREAERVGEEQAGDPDDVTLLLLVVHAGASRFENARSAGAAGDGDGRAPASGRSGSASLWYGEGETQSWLALRGRATWRDADAFYEAARAIRAAGRPLVLDLGGCAYLDSTCLGTLHEIVATTGAQLHAVSPAARELLVELSMDAVLAAVRPAGVVPELHPLRDGMDPAAGRRRMLRAHEALAALAPANRDRFRNVLEALRE